MIHHKNLAQIIEALKNGDCKDKVICPIDTEGRFNGTPGYVLIGIPADWTAQPGVDSTVIYDLTESGNELEYYARDSDDSGDDEGWERVTRQTLIDSIGVDKVAGLEKIFDCDAVAAGEYVETHMVGVDFKIVYPG